MISFSTSATRTSKITFLANAEESRDVSRTILLHSCSLLHASQHCPYHVKSVSMRYRNGDASLLHLNITVFGTVGADVAPRGQGCIAADYTANLKFSERVCLDSAGACGYPRMTHFRSHSNYQRYRASGSFTRICEHPSGDKMVLP